jgi:hypothetical protein
MISADGRQIFGHGFAVKRICFAAIGTILMI